MKKIILAACSIVAITLSITFSAEPDINLHLKCIYPCVKIETDNGCGSGNIIYSAKFHNMYLNVAVTCAHVIKNFNTCDVIRMKYKDFSNPTGQEKYPSRVYYIDYKTDIALLAFISDEKMPTSDIQFKEGLYIGNSVRAFGYGDRMDIPRMDCGEITAVNLHLPGLGNSFYRTNINTLTGDSGSAVFYNKKIIGIRMAILLKNDEQLNNSSIVVPIEKLLDMSVFNKNYLNWIWESKESSLCDIEGGMLCLPSMSEITIDDTKLPDSSCDIEAAPEP